jgi:cytochrome P450
MTGSQPVGAPNTPSPSTPGQESDLPLNDFPEFVRDPLGFLRRKWKQLGDVAEINFGPRPNFLVVHPDGVKQVLQNYPERYDKSNLVSYQRMRSIVGKGLVTSEGDIWKEERRVAHAAFDPRQLHHFVPHMQRSLADMQTRWENLAAQRESINVHGEMKRLTIRAATLILLSVTADHEHLGDSLMILLDEFMHRLYSIFQPADQNSASQDEQFVEAQRNIEKAVQAIIEERRKTGNFGNDLLGQLMAAKDSATGLALTDDLVREELTTMFFAVYENTALALTWTWRFLGRYPEVRKKLEDELIACLGGRLPDAGDLERLKYIKAVLQESMRLNPPVSVFYRYVLQDDVIGGRPIPQGSGIILSPYLTHRHPEFWDDPEAFSPARFKVHNSRHRFAYFPFGGGPRVCVGASLAMLQATQAIATVAQRFHLDLEPESEAGAAETFTLQPPSRLPMRLTARHCGLHPGS